ncbi:DOPA 4,5-dioxygenase family protein [Novosphingobium terrae]|uniref:DOPA 4,5-dioxygenase family protein n=1 Tax=Novosphingobium terrae TaxID=2726189 RepID=UPI00198268E7|nr:DOPA 4,5-dioxygenase family protein [Novosphingobium terrae]
MAHPEDQTEKQPWAEIPAPDRRSLLTGGMMTMGALASASWANTASAATAGEVITPAASVGIPAGKAGGTLPLRPSTFSGKSEWGYHTAAQPTPQPASVRTGEEVLPTHPRPYTDIKSYHAHIYFDEDNHYKAALLRRWVAERFDVELGDWNLKPRGPHVTPSFYFGFQNELLPVVIPWLQLNSLGLTILIHPNSDNARSDHLYYALWVNRSQPVNAYSMKAVDDSIEVFTNTQPSVPIET